ncbi:BRCA1associated protein 2 subfamily protein [Acanthamoeba castellanii str. Neff]|uniref:BRCA1associated protein 2 subfamily protein n=1 Tax=Acanthamoeba castellanii (strain ATCC 30010 / Neff) TaxID=1257118 RepID=L8HER1_ACACF|nr:BRCA1associated protein 2 subfamily protein [Acanthamoeba castellanii str. Neff]ELR22901.1 BRCA1associated protein 2 subfamily protein [Acanthamoeba castellanii str. Neff]
MYRLKVGVFGHQSSLPNNIAYDEKRQRIMEYRTDSPGDAADGGSAGDDASKPSYRDILRKSRSEKEKLSEEEEGKPAGDEDVVRVSVGNPFIEVIKGVVHLYKDPTTTTAAKRGQLPPKWTLIVAVLAVPSWMAVADFCQFVAPYQKLIARMRVVTYTEKVPGRYAVLLEFRQQVMADQFYLEYNGKMYNSMESEECRVGFVKSVEFVDGSSMEPILPPCGTNELPTCPVCLDRLDTSVTGILTTVCNHTFHCLCLSKWRDSSCPSESLWICLICGHIGCGRYKGGHANNHWLETQHTYALELESQRVWDYAGDNYVHRLIQSKADGKLVELPGPETQIDEEIKEGILESKRTAVAMEYTYLLTSQLESQRQFWEHQLQVVESQKGEKVQHLEHELKKEKEEKQGLLASINELNQTQHKSKKKITQLEKKISQYQRDVKELKQYNETLTHHQAEWKEQAQKAAEALRTQSAATETRIKELEEQVRDLMFFIDAKNKIEDSGEELKEGSLLITEKPSPTRRGARGGKKRGK